MAPRYRITLSNEERTFEDAEFLLGLYVQGKDFFEPLPMAVAKHIIRK